MIDELIARLVNQQKHASSTELVDIASHVATAPFATDLLEADEPLWGSFWQFDVIAPGYTLPAIELAFLRATRLDGNWPEATTIDQFLADLRQAILHPRAGIWSLPAAGEPCVVFAVPTEQDPNLKSTTVVWYCASTGQLHAGYRVAAGALHFAGAITQRQPEFTNPQSTNKNDKPDWLALAVQQLDINEGANLAARLDAEILRLRLGG